MVPFSSAAVGNFYSALDTVSRVLQSQDPPPQAQPTPSSNIPASSYDKAIFQKPIPSDQLAFLNQFAGKATEDLDRDKQFRKLMHSVIPDCAFHYGVGYASFRCAPEMVLKGSTHPVQIRDGRYRWLRPEAGRTSPGRGFVWIDLQDGIALGGFYFHPTNGEPTPTLNIFSRQVKEESLRMSQLPPVFPEDFRRWGGEARVAPITTRYFSTGANKKILLEHDEDYCLATASAQAPPQDVCEQMNRDAADIDMDAAYYLEQTNHVTNATAWMITGEDQVAWLRFGTTLAGLVQIRSDATSV